MRRTPVFSLVLSASVLLASCSEMRTPYGRPDTHVSLAYVHADESAKASLDHWWRSLGDSNLDALVAEALKNNSDLALAVLNVRAARLQVHLAVINPTLGAGYTYDYSKPVRGATPATQFHSLTGSAAYEIDLWDQLGALKDAARWEARATEQDRQSAVLTVIGTTVNLYYQIAELNQRIALGQQSIAYAQKTLDLVKIQVSAGSASNLEVAQSEKNLQFQRAGQTEMIEQRVETRNVLAVVLNGASWPEQAEPLTVPENPPPAVASDLPVSLLDRRPDLRAAELRLRMALAQTDATRLSFYPNLSLTGSLGTASTGLSELVSNPLGSLAVTLSAPFVQINQAKFATALAHTQYDQAVVNFRKTLLQALIDVDNALSARAQLAEEGRQLERSLESAKTAERIYEIRYREGSVALQSWLDSQETRRQAAVALTNNQLTRLQNFATLCQALGGGPNLP
jgi:NodT family efflux transporter outer membrane factor (OMF) lipoprotein